MSTLLEKKMIIERFKVLNNSLNNVFNIDNIEEKLEFSREAYVDLQLQQIFKDLYSDLNENKAYDQIVTELSNSLSLITEIKQQIANKQLNQSTKRAIETGCKYIYNKLTFLKSRNEDKLRVLKAKSKLKFDDIKVSEKEFALFIILSEKYGLISKIPKANEKAIAFSALTNISEQSLRDNIGSKYQIKPEELLLKKDNLTVLKDVLIAICDEIEHIKDNTTN